jgi:hypothetical protein
MQLTSLKLNCEKNDKSQIISHTTRQHPTILPPGDQELTVGYYQYMHSVGHGNKIGQTCHTEDNQDADNGESHYKMSSPRLVNNNHYHHNFSTSD